MFKNILKIGLGLVLLTIGSLAQAQTKEVVLNIDNHLDVPLDVTVAFLQDNNQYLPVTTHVEAGSKAKGFALASVGLGTPLYVECTGHPQCHRAVGAMRITSGRSLSFQTLEITYDESIPGLVNAPSGLTVSRGPIGPRSGR